MLKLMRLQAAGWHYEQYTNGYAILTRKGAKRIVLELSTQFIWVSGYQGK